MNCVSYNKSKFIILKLKIKLTGAIVKDIINKTLYIKIKFGVFNTKYKKPTFKKV